MADTEDTWPVVFHPCDEAESLCGADVERGDEAAAGLDCWSTRLRLTIGTALCLLRGVLGAGRRFIHCGHVFFANGRPFLDGGASFCASGLTRKTSRSGRRTSTVCTSRFRMALDRSRRASWAHALAGVSVGRSTSIALSM